MAADSISIGALIPNMPLPSARSCETWLLTTRPETESSRNSWKTLPLDWPTTDLPGKLLVFKNNVDSFGTTYGSHENYLVTPEAMDRIGSIVPFLVTRQIFAGAGRVVTGAEAADSPFRLAQRSDFIDRVFSDRTSQVRGIINPRKREIPRQGQNRRLHLLVGDSNLSECAIGLKVGCTSLVLRLTRGGSARKHSRTRLAGAGDQRNLPLHGSATEPGRRERMGQRSGHPDHVSGKGAGFLRKHVRTTPMTGRSSNCGARHSTD